MARWPDADAVYDTAKVFRQQCLVDGRSLLWPDQRAWAIANIDALIDALAVDPGDSRVTFIDKLEAQLADQPDDVLRVAADVLTLYFLYPSAATIKGTTKLATIETITRWRPNTLDITTHQQQQLEAAFAHGIGRTGRFYLSDRPRHLAFLLMFSKGVIQGRADPLDPASCKQLIEEMAVETQGRVHSRHILLHLLFPDQFETLVSDSDKLQIVNAFQQDANGAQDVDDALANIRQKLTSRLDRSEFDFYDPDVRRFWDSSATRTSEKDQSNGAEKVGDVLKQAYPDATIRMLCLRQLAVSIRTAHEISPASWGTTFRSGTHVRLNVGRIETLILADSQLRVIVDRAAADDATWSRIRNELDLAFKWDGQPFKVIPTAYGVNVPDGRIEEALSILQPLHLDLVRRAAGSVRQRTTFYRSHSPEVLEYLRQELGEDIPDPDYGINEPSDQAVVANRRYWKIAPGERSSRWEEFRQHGRIAVGWDGTPDLRTLSATTLDEFRARLADLPVFQERTYSLSHAANQLWSFFHEMQSGDLVCAYGSGRIHGWGEITGDYAFEDGGADYAHRRATAWTSVEPVHAESLPTPIVDKLRQNTTIVELTAEEFAVSSTSTAPSETSWRDQPYVEPPFADIVAHVAVQGLRLDGRTLRRYHLALKARGFVILSGLSGTGKTWLAEVYARAVGARHVVIPIAPNWTTNEDLLGYQNPLTDLYHDTAFGRFLRDAAAAWHRAEAAGQSAQPYHVVLDEMNLARVEYYFAKFLSAMETRARAGSAAIELGPNETVRLTPNLMVIGTVNIDETTHGFADKIYDRVQLVELEVRREDIAAHLTGRPYQADLLRVWDEMHRVGPFTFRVLDEIAAYVEGAAALDVPWEEALDEQLLHKVLPKVKGADPAVGDALNRFVDLTAGRFPLSHARAAEMLEGFKLHGFASYFR